MALLASGTETRLHEVADMLAGGAGVEEVAAASMIDPWFVDQLFLIKEVADQVAPGRVLTEMVSGHPATEILRMAHEGDFDVIVLGTHGRRGLRRLMMGSVAAEVARTAPCSVVVVRPRSRGEFEVVPD